MKKLKVVSTIKHPKNKQEGKMFMVVLSVKMDSLA